MSPVTVFRDKSAKMSKYFRLGEFYCKDGTPPPSASIPAIRKLCVDILDPLREKYGPCTVLSGYRHATYNARIGGARYSQHIYDVTPSSVAADIRFAKGSPKKWKSSANWLMLRKWGMRWGFRRMGGIGIYIHSNFIHVDNRPYRANWSG